MNTNEYRLIAGRYRKFSDADKIMISKLRNKSTQAEDKVWGLLRNRQVMGLKFRRQHKIGTYIIDFYSIKLRLAIEIDGEIHVARKHEDKARSKWLESLGIQVLRFSNSEVVTQPERILKEIRKQCEISGSHFPKNSHQQDLCETPPPQKGGGANGGGEEEQN